MIIALHIQRIVYEIEVKEFRLVNDSHVHPTPHVSPLYYNEKNIGEKVVTVFPHNPAL
jgi:hypothetical protein